MICMMLGMSVIAQQKIQLRSADRAECVKSDMTSLKASFSFSTIEAQDYESERGTFSWLSLPNTVIGGNVGDPQIPVVNELIAVPVGSNPYIEITSYSTTEYRLEDYGIRTLVPRQPSLRKDKKPEDVPFMYNAAAYQTRGLRNEPTAVVEVVGTMRGVQLGKMTIEPVSYDPVSNTIRVFNDIEVEVHFDGADARATEDLLVKTYSPYFDIVYKQLFNDRALRDIYSQHPDLYTTPVKMLVVTTSTYANSTAFQNWLTWKKQKGIDVDVQTVANSASASTIKNLIYSRYNANHPSFLVLVGDETVVTYYSLWDYDSTYGNAATDLEYASVDGDVYHDMFLSRMPVSSTTELNNLVNKILTYEKYTMSDPSYLSETLLIAGWDSSATAYIGKPTIQYANNYYFNTAHGITPHVFLTTASGQTTCYNYINNVGFVNYTAHGDIQKWHDPEFTNSNVNSLTNNDKYFWAMGNCCLTANFKNANNNQTCFGETMVRAANKGAWGYIGSVPESYWYEDYYFGVGATNTFGQMPTQAQTTTGVYDAMFDDTGFNTLNAVPFIGNVAVSYAHANSYTSSVTDEYYWRAYQCFGDGSVMPYHTVPAANNVSHNDVLPLGASSFTVSADAGSYVSITVDNEIIGVAQVPSNGTIAVPITAQNTAGTAMIVVTRNQRQPYIGTIQIVGGTQYDITVNQPQHGTISAPEQAYAQSTVTLTATPETGYCLSSWDVRDANNNSITVTDNEFIMPNSDVTVTATFEQGMQITLAQVTNGSISADLSYALQGMTVNLTATPANGYEFDSWVVYKTDDMSTTVSLSGNSFTMPNYPVTVSANFVVGDTELTVYDGTATNQYIPMYGYYFDDYTKSECIIPASQLTAMTGCTVSAITFYPSSVGTRTWGESQQTVFLKEVSGTTLGGSYSGMSGATTVKVSSPMEMPVVGTPYTITFDTPYTYNGGNLLIGVYNTDDGSYNDVQWYGTSGLTSGVSASGYNSSNLNSVAYNAQSFLPKTTFTYRPVITPYISLAPNSVTMLVDDTETLTATYGNVSGTPTITYTSSNTNVATVSGSGTTATVTAIAVGNATITASMTVGGTTYTATCAVTVEVPSYCAPSFSSPSDDYISNFTTTGGTANINNTSTYESGGYSDYYSSHSASINTGETLSCTITSSSTQWSYGHAIWVDWNQDYEFSSDEKMDYTTSTATGNWTGNVVVPDNADAGDYRLRVIHLYNNTPTDPCMNGQYGEAEDYKITVLAPVTTPVEITASANPAEGGTITGTGTYDPGTQCTLTATANEGYTFTNWTKNGMVISTNATYSFTVSTAAEYVANFTTNSYTITATAVPAEGGMVTFGARNRDDLVYDFEDGWQGWTALKGTAGNSPNNWMHNTSYPTSNNNFTTGYGRNSSDGFMLSESYISGSTSGSGTAVTPDNYLISPQVRLGGSISFYAGARNTSYCAEKFSVMVSTTDNTNTASFTTVQTWILTLDEVGYTSEPYTVDLSEYSGMGYIAIRHWDCYDQWILCIDDITIVEGPDNSSCDGNFLYGESCTVIATPVDDYHFVNWTENGEEVSTDASYTFTVNGDRELVANFSQFDVQTIELVEGWNWVAFNVDITLDDLKETLVEALPNAAIIIKSQTEKTSYNPTSHRWSGRINSWDLTRMYKISVSAACEITLEGNRVNSTENPIIVNSGVNWIAYPLNTSMNVTDAFNGFAINGDVIKSQTNKAQYTRNRWQGQFNTLEPGKGFIYNSNSTEDRPLVFGINKNKKEE